MTEADILAMTYYHRARVLRPVHGGGPWDSYNNDLVYDDLPCAVSFSGGSAQGESDTYQAIEYLAVLFARPDVAIEAGDLIEANVHARVYEFKAGEGVIYPSHIEVPLIRKDRA